VTGAHSAAPGPAPLPVLRPDGLPRRDPGQQWLVEQLWPAAGAGIIGADSLRILSRR